MIKENKQCICKSLREFKKEFFIFINGDFKESIVLPSDNPSKDMLGVSFYKRDSKNSEDFYTLYLTKFSKRKNELKEELLFSNVINRPWILL